MTALSRTSGAKVRPGVARGQTPGVVLPLRFHTNVGRTGLPNRKSGGGEESAEPRSGSDGHRTGRHDQFEATCFFLWKYLCLMSGQNSLRTFEKASVAT